MNTLLHSLDVTVSHPAPATLSYGQVRQPLYETREQAQELVVQVYIPGVPRAGVEIFTEGNELAILARRGHVVRVNWQSLHLESAQRDYVLRLTLAEDLALEQLQASLNEGVLTLIVPRKAHAEEAVSAPTVVAA